MNAAEPSRFTRDRIAALVERALRESGALGVLPTPLDAVTAAAALELVEAPGLRPDVLGAIWFEERTVFVNGGQSGPRRRFTQAHEIVHALCGWHYAALREDTEASLFGPARDAIEAEANAGAAMLIFQAGEFRERAAELPCTLASVRLLAKTFGASLHATLHHYVQSHPHPVAMLTVGRFPRRDATLPVWRRIESPSFRAASANALGSLSPGLLPGTRLRALVEDARTANGVTAVLGDGPLHLEAEAQYNRHSFLLLVRAAAIHREPVGGGRVGTTRRGSRSLQRRDVQPVQPAVARPCDESGPAAVDRRGVRAQAGVDRRAAGTSRR